MPTGRRSPPATASARRAAIEFAIGQVSSFHTRYRAWQAGDRTRRNAAPPRLNRACQVPMTMYRGACIKYHEKHVELKVYNGSDWVWISVPIRKKGKRHEVPTNKDLSPSIILKKNKCFLSIPYQLKPKKLKGDFVCSVDLGINQSAVASIVSRDGTVTSRRFFHRGADIDRRDKLQKRISKLAKLTTGSGGKLPKGFARRLHRRVAGINQNMIRHVAKEIVTFTIEHGASTIGFENLKHFRPKGGKSSR